MKYIFRVVLVLWFCGISQAGGEVITLTRPEFTLVSDGFFEQHLDFTLLPENKTVDMTYWGSSPEAEIKYQGKSFFIRYQNKALEQLQLRFGQAVKLSLIHI